MSVQPATPDMEVLFQAQVTLISRFRQADVNISEEGEQQLLSLLNEIKEMLDLPPLTEKEWDDIINKRYYGYYGF